MKKSGIIILVLVMMLSIPLFSDEGKHNQNIDDVIELILEEQDLKDRDKIDPDKVSNKLLEQLGEAYMSWMHPNEKHHEWMDKMMGGEGSQSLKEAHIRMGYSYLDNDSWGFCGRGHRGPGMMGWWGKKK